MKYLIIELAGLLTLTTGILPAQNITAFNSGSAQPERLIRTVDAAQHLATHLGKCAITADNPAQPLITWPWNAFVCGYNSHGWVWLVSINKLSPSNYMVMAKYLPTFSVIGDESMSEGSKTRFYGPDGQSVTVSVTKTTGDAKNWRQLKAWVHIVGIYQED
jgi:hypothetical protein